MSNISISTITSGSPKYKEVFELRDEILRRPLGRELKNDDLSRDHIDTIFIAEHEGRIIGCVLLHRLSDEEVQLRAMAVYNEWQGKGVGRMLVQALEKHTQEKAMQGWCSTPAKWRSAFIPASATPYPVASSQK